MRLPSEKNAWIVGDSCRSLQLIRRILDDERVPTTSFRCAAEVYRQLETETPFLVATSLDNGEAGLELIERIHAITWPMASILLIKEADTRLTVRALRFGVHAVLNESCEIEELLKELKSALRRSTAKLVKVRSQGEALSKLRGLSARHLTIMNDLAICRSIKEIARHIGMSPRTVHSCKREVYRCLGVTNLAEFIAYKKMAERYLSRANRHNRASKNSAGVNMNPAAIVVAATRV